jgi:hypothetical protein
LPLLFSGIYLFNHLAVQEELENRFRTAAKKGAIALERKARKEHFILNHSSVDPFFLDKHIESLLFLQSELSTIQSMLQHPALANKRLLQERLQFLESGKNRLAFIEENIRSTSKIKETDERQRHPVQMDEKDLQKLLAYVEQIPIDQTKPIDAMPQLVVRDMKIKKTENALHSEIYEVEMQLLKREWMEP